MIKTPLELKVEELLPEDIKITWTRKEWHPHCARREIDGKTYEVLFFIPNSQNDIEKQAKSLVLTLKTALAFDKWK